MKTFKKYYNAAKKEHERWENGQKVEWWKKEEFQYKDKFSTKGDYIETVSFIGNDIKINSPVFANTTNVPNSEWGIFFSALGMALIDWCIENTDWSGLYSFGLTITRIVDGKENLYCFKPHILKKKGKNETAEGHGDFIKVDSEPFNECCDFICEFFDWFISRFGKDIPNNWNGFSFGLDMLSASCKYGQWVSDSDGNMTLYNDSGDEFEEIVNCM